MVSPLTPRLERALVAGAIGLVIALVVSILSERSPSAAITRGDFPAFYTLAQLASGDQAASLYDIEAQRRIQNNAWPSMSGSVLPAAYPAYVALFVHPLAFVDVMTARLVWVGSMLLCVFVALQILVRAFPSLHGLGWQVSVGAFLFSPLFLGVVGGQIVGVSVLCYAVLVALDRKRDRLSEVISGIAAGVWMVKPHFGLAAAAVLLVERRWLAVGSWFVVTVGLWCCGAYVAGPTWIGEWLSFAGRFSEIDLFTNSFQMTGVVPLTYSFVARLGGAPLAHPGVWDVITGISALMVPVGLLLATRISRLQGGGVRASILVLGPLLLLFAPAVNFYDLSLALVPLFALCQPTHRRDITVAGLLIGLSQGVELLKGPSVPGLCFLITLVCSCLVAKAIARSDNRAGHYP